MDIRKKFAGIARISRGGIRDWKETLILSILAVLALLQICAWDVKAETVMIPAGITEIHEEAFAGCTSVESVYIPDGVTRIGAGAFAGCTALREVQFPHTLEEIGEDALKECGECLLVTCTSGSMAASWAAANGFDWNADTVCRALSIGQTYTQTSYALVGPVNDMHAVAFCLRRMNVNNYMVTEKANLTAQEILDTIRTTFADAGENDISLLYFSGHGEMGGALLGSDLATVSPQELRNCLNSVPGRKVVIVDACYSGGLLEEDEVSAAENISQEDEKAAFLSAFLQAFTIRSRALYETGKYFIMASCCAAEKSEEAYIKSGSAGRYMGYFTYALCEGCGWNGVTYRECEMLADQNGDGVATFAEAYSYAYDWALSENNGQHAVVYPEDCRWFSPFRK